MTKKEQFKNLGSELGTLVGEKDEQYGEMMNSTAKYLEALFPNGIKPEQYGIVGLQVRVFDKLRRSTHAGHDNAEDWRDISGYGLQGLAHYSAADVSDKDVGKMPNAEQLEKEDSMRIIAKSVRKRYCEKRKSEGKPCHECQLGRIANAEDLHCDQYTRFYPDVALEIMRKAVNP